MKAFYRTRSIVLLVILACGEDTLMAGKQDQSGPYIPTTANSSFSIAEDASGREAQEAALIAEILARLPEERRAALRTALNDRSMRPSGSSDQAISELIGKLLAVREASLRSLVATAREKDRSIRTERGVILLSIALVDSLPEDLIGVVRREPADGGVPLLLMKHDVTAAQLARGIAAAEHQLATLGSSVKRTVRMVLRNKGSAREPKQIERLSELLAMARGADMQTVEGIGAARLIHVHAPRQLER
ncbi:MAG: hypothetical protein ACT4OZ_07300 [Gemmatimonadota bacterium]